MTLLLRMDDQMNRQLTGELTEADTPDDLANELVTHCLINPVSHCESRYVVRDEHAAVGVTPFELGALTGLVLLVACRTTVLPSPR